MVGCPDGQPKQRGDRMHQYGKHQRHSVSEHVTFADEAFGGVCVPEILPSIFLPMPTKWIRHTSASTVVVGLLIDRRIQLNRVSNEAAKLTLPQLDCLSISSLTSMK
jgi:hypothetical protein